MARKKKEPDKLAQDAAAALAARMSYGKWKATQIKPEETERKVPEGWRVCEWCGKAYKPKTQRPQRFCEVECQKQAYKKKNGQRDCERMRQWRAKKKAEAAEKAVI